MESAGGGSRKPRGGNEETLEEVIEEIVDEAVDEAIADAESSGLVGALAHEAYDVRERFALQQGEINALKAILSTVTSRAALGPNEGTLKDMLDNSLATISDRLEPLRELIPIRTGTDLPDEVSDAVIAMQESLARPDWSAAGTLSVPEQRVLPIGEPGTIRSNRDPGSQSRGSAS